MGLHVPQIGSHTGFCATAPAAQGLRDGQRRITTLRSCNAIFRCPHGVRLAPRLGMELNIVYLDCINHAINTEQVVRRSRVVWTVARVSLHGLGQLAIRCCLLVELRAHILHSSSAIARGCLGT